MAVSGLSLSSALAVQSAVDMRNQLESLQRQLGTGKRADDYAGLGLERGLTVGLREHLAGIAGYQESITQVGVRLNIAQSALTEIQNITQTARNASIVSQFALNGGNQTIDQQSMRLQLDHLLGVLNTTTGDRYLFSGTAVDQ